MSNGLKIYYVFIATWLLTGCFGTATKKDGPAPYHVDMSHVKNAIPKYEAKSRYGNPSSYVVNGKRYYVLNSAYGYNKRGIASWYGWKFHKQLTSTREPYNMFAMTAASPVLPIPCYVRVTNLQNGRSVIVRVNDRGPFAPNRIIDLSYAAAYKLGYMRKGTALVQVTAIDTRHHYYAPPAIQVAHNTPKIYLQLGAFSHWQNASRLKRYAQRYTKRPIAIKRSDRHNQPL